MKEDNRTRLVFTSRRMRNDVTVIDIRVECKIRGSESDCSVTKRLLGDGI